MDIRTVTIERARTLGAEIEQYFRDLALYHRAHGRGADAARMTQWADCLVQLRETARDA